MRRTPARAGRHARSDARQFAIAAFMSVAAFVMMVGAVWAVVPSGSHAPRLMALDTPAAAPAPPAAAEAPAPAPASPVQQAAPDVSPAVVYDHPTFDGRPLRAVRTITMKVTAYSPDSRSCGKFADGVTASGYSVWTNGMKLVAADTKLLPFGTVITVPGYNGGRPVPVLDRGGKIKGKRLDVLYPTHEIARQWGVQDLQVTVWEYAD